MSRKKTTLILIISIITTILAVAVLVLFFRIINNKNIHTSSVLSTLDQKMEEKENIEILQEKIFEIEETRDNLSNHLFNSEFIDTFVSYIEDLGASVGTQISVVGIESIKNEKNLMQIKISSQGSFSNVAKSIALIENMPYQIDIMQIYLNKDLSPSDEKDNQTEIKQINGQTWSADITFNIKSSN